MGGCKKRLREWEDERAREEREHRGGKRGRKREGKRGGKGGEGGKRGQERGNVFLLQLDLLLISTHLRMERVKFFQIISFLKIEFVLKSEYLYLQLVVVFS